MINTDTKRFANDGYCLFRDVLSATEIDSIRAELDKAIAELPE